MADAERSACHAAILAHSKALLRDDRTGLVANALRRIHRELLERNQRLDKVYVCLQSVSSAPLGLLLYPLAAEFHNQWVAQARPDF